MYDAVRVRLIEIGEAIKDTDAALLESGPDIPWIAVARMRDRLAHRCFDTDHSIVAASTEEELPPSSLQQGVCSSIRTCRSSARHYGTSRCWMRIPCCGRPAVHRYPAMAVEDRPDPSAA